MPTTAKPTPSWRDVLPIHPAAELFPRMSPDELRALGEDIKKRGLMSPIMLWSPSIDDDQTFLLDGRNRLDAMELVGVAFELYKDDERRRWVFRVSDGLPSGGQPSPRHLRGLDDPYAYVFSANIHRRHLSAEQKRELIAKLLKAQPEKSDRQIAETMKASPTTVGTVRAEMEAKGDVSKLDTRTDTRGRQQPARKAGKLAKGGGDKKSDHRGTKKHSDPPTLADQGVDKSRNDVGPDSHGEAERLRARNEELEGENRRLQRENIALRSEIEELKARLLDIPPMLDRRNEPAKAAP
jgi:hypothetical protein